ncbi:hypothetical protein WOLCODRAFT_132795 [Wolfiporia cocos MD-104 SS10]|uniref:Secreted protein n=1 Tax=Wolfiporia cocos (strain MD-104) TaxID=742152 RepID=A0A2H3JPS3_WOLCO|nr:hypothetical protein WOLCODRAFT_132795 [Wolfiporia cocos MD-104 SS10]
MTTLKRLQYVLSWISVVSAWTHGRPERYWYSGRQPFGSCLVLTAVCFEICYCIAHRTMRSRRCCLISLPGKAERSNTP